MQGIKEHGYQLVEQFKMHLHPPSILQDVQLRLKRKPGFFPALMSIKFFKISHDLVPAIPNGLTLLQVYADFLTYLVAQTRRHLSDELRSDPWLSLGDRIEILLTHPNRWGNFEQQFLEAAVVRANIFPPESVLARLKFAEESEAAASFCLPIAKIRLKITVRRPIHTPFRIACLSPAVNLV